MKNEPSELFPQSAQQRPLSQQKSTSTEEHAASLSSTSNKQKNQEDLPPEPPEEAHARMLHEVAQITAQSFHSSQEAMRVALEVIGNFLECQSLFVARSGSNEPETTNRTDSERFDQCTLEIMEARNTGMPSPIAGSVGPLNRTYCATVIRTQQPLIVEDVRRHLYYQRLATTEEYHIGSYIGVPLIYSDGRVYGTLCSQDPHPRPLAAQPEKLELMQIVARFLISYIEREELTMHLRQAQEAQAELACQEQQARAEADRRVHELEAIFESIGDGLLVCDLNGRIQMNAAARGLLPVGFVQGDLQELFENQHDHALMRDEHGQPLALDQWPMVRVLRGEHLTGTHVLTLQHMNEQEEQRYLSVSGMPIYNQQKQVTGGVLLFRDRTEQYLLERRTQETLNALLELTESLAWLPENAPAFFSAAPDPQRPVLQMTWKRLKPLISTILQCQEVGMVALEPDTETWHLLTNDDAAYQRTSPWWQQIAYCFPPTSAHGLDVARLRNNEIVMHPLQSQGRGETPMLVEAPMFLGQCLLGALVLMYRQHNPVLTSAEEALAKAVAKLTGLIHERERLLHEQAETRAHALALQEIHERFNEFLSIASHELKGPLTALKGNIQLARRTLQTLRSQRAQQGEAWSSTLEKLQRYLERAEHQISIQNRLTSDLIDVSRIRAGKLALHIQSCDLGQVVHQVVEDQRQIAEGRVITLELSEEKISVCGDADRLGQVVSNYLTNALKYSSSDQPVGVSITRNGSEVRVTVSDQGTGLTLEQQQHVWERFYRVKGVQGLSGHGIGLGLGLHICKTIIEQHGGNVGVQSTPGKGSHFWFTLSLVPQKP